MSSIILQSVTMSVNHIAYASVGSFERELWHDSWWTEHLDSAHLRYQPVLVSADFQISVLSAVSAVAVPWRRITI